jgi:putative hemolysin
LSQVTQSKGPVADLDRLMVDRLPRGSRWLGPATRELLGFNTAAALLKDLSGESPADFVRHLLDSLGIRWTVDAYGPLPADGPLIVAANHPLGLIDGLVLLDYMFRVRGDVRLLGNHQLGQLPVIGPIVLPVTPRSKQASGRASGALTCADAHLKQGGSLLIFPAGAVARCRRDGIATDDRWRTGVASLASLNRCPVVPAAVLAQNSGTFYTVAKLSRSAADALVIREALALRGAIIPLASGAPMSPIGVSREEIEAFSTDLRLAVNALLKANAAAGMARSQSPLTANYRTRGGRRRRCAAGDGRWKN